MPEYIKQDRASNMWSDSSVSRADAYAEGRTFKKSLWTMLREFLHVCNIIFIRRQRKATYHSLVRAHPVNVRINAKPASQKKSRSTHAYAWYVKGITAGLVSASEANGTPSVWHWILVRAFGRVVHARRLQSSSVLILILPRIIDYHQGQSTTTMSSVIGIVVALVKGCSRSWVK